MPCRNQDLTPRPLARLLEETPELIQTLARSLANLGWRESNAGNADIEPPPTVIERLINVHLGQIESNYNARPGLALLA